MTISKANYIPTLVALGMAILTIACIAASIDFTNPVSALTVALAH